MSLFKKVLKRMEEMFLGLLFHLFTCGRLMREVSYPILC
jgi:hypothetical protein